MTSPFIRLIRDYYKTSGLAKIPKKADILKNEELYQLYKRPAKDKGKYIPTMNPDIEPKAVIQADLLYLPNDNDFKYALVCVDVNTGLTDAVPLRERDANTVLEAYKKIRSRQPLKDAPTYILQTDSGSEFKGVFAKHLKSLGIYMRYGKPGRSRQQAFVESRNKTIGQALFHRMLGQEILTDEQSNSWVKHLPKVIKIINDYHKKKKNRKIDKKPYIPKDTVMLSIGQPVRILLDKPRDTITDKKLFGTFRATDFRWSRTISKITNIIIDDDNPILYQVDNQRSPAYTFNQLLPVNEDDMKAPLATDVMEGTPTQYVVEKIIDKKKEKNKVYYRVVWKGYPLAKDYTWELKSHLERNPLLKEMIQKFENK